jgi:5-dehydro-4-deoxyglucarate dehydratase
MALSFGIFVFAFPGFKAGVRLVGFDAGRVRPPLDDLTEEEEGILQQLIEASAVIVDRAA